MLFSLLLSVFEEFPVPLPTSLSFYSDASPLLSLIPPHTLTSSFLSCTLSLKAGQAEPIPPEYRGRNQNTVAGNGKSANIFILMHFYLQPNFLSFP